MSDAKIRPLFFVLFSICGVVYGQLDLLFKNGSDGAGSTAFTTLNLNDGARNEALGGNAGSLLYGSEAISVNAAMLAHTNRSDLSLSHKEMPMGMRMDKVSFVYPTFEYGTFGFQWKSFRSGLITDARNIDEEVVDVSTGDMSLGAAYAIAFIDGTLSVGAFGQFLQSNLADASARGFSFDISTSALILQTFRTTLSLHNMGAGVSFGNVKEPLPLGISTNIALPVFENRVSITAGIKKSAGSDLESGFGIETHIHSLLSLQMGYAHRTGETEKSEKIFDGLRFGTGINIGDFKINYAYSKINAFLGLTHSIEARYNFSPLIPPNASDYLRRAERQFREGRFSRCISSAEQALRLNPNLWQAHALIEEAHRRLKVNEGSIFAVFYTGNTNGVFVPSLTNGLGGLARRSALLKMLRDGYPYSVTVDGGNLCKQDADSVLWKIGFDVLKEMNYTAVCAGYNEVAAPITKILPYIKKNGTPFISSTGTKGVEASTTIDAGGGYKIIVSSALAASRKIDPLLTSSNSGATIKLLLFSGTASQAKLIARSNPLIDLIICSNDLIPTYKAIQEGRTIIVSPGKDGNYLGQLLLQCDKNRKIIGVSNRLHPLDASTPEDERIKAALRSLVAKGDIATINDSLFRQEDTWLPFISKYDFTLQYKPKTVKDTSINADMRRTDTTNQIYLASVRTNQKIRVSHNRRHNRLPEINRQKSGVIYLSDSISTGYNSTDLFVYFTLYNITRAIKKDDPFAIPLTAKWSAEGDAIYLIEKDKTGKSELFLQSVRGNGRINISRSPESSEFEVAVSPDGKNIAFTSDREAGQPIYISDPYGEKPMRLLNSQAYCANPEFSASGRYLSFTVNGNRATGSGDLFLFDTKTGKIDTLIAGQPVSEAKWANDETILAVQGELYTDIIRINVREKTFHRHTDRTRKAPVKELTPRPFMVGDTLKVYYEQEIDGKNEIYWTESPTNRPIKFYNQSGVVHLR